MWPGIPGREWQEKNVTWSVVFVKLKKKSQTLCRCKTFQAGSQFSRFENYWIGDRSEKYFYSIPSAADWTLRNLERNKDRGEAVREGKQREFA